MKPLRSFVLPGLLLVQTVLGLGTSPVRGDVYLTAGPDRLWVVWGYYPPDQNDASVRIGWTEDPSPAAFRFPFVPREGSVRQIAADAEGLHVFFADGVHYRFAERTSGVELNVPGRSAPLAAGSNIEGQGVVVLLPTSSVKKFVQSRVDALPTTQPGDLNPDADGTDVEAARRDRDRLAANPDARFWLLFYENGRWEIVDAVPPSMQLTSLECWLAADADRIHMVWRPAGDQRVLQHAIRNDAGWSEPATIPDTEDVSRGSLDLSNGVTFFIGGVPAPNEPGKLVMQPFVADGQKWQTRDVLREDDKPVPVATDAFAAAVFANQIAVVNETGDDDQPIRVGFWPVTGGTATQPAEVPARIVPPPQTWLDSSWWETLSYVALFSIMILIFVRRQDSLLIGARLDPGFTLAGYGRRLLAFLLDLMPALILTIPLWRGPFQELADLMPDFQTDSEPPPEALAAKQQLWWPWLWARLIFFAYGTLMETFLGTTLGKMAMRLSVRRLDGRPPGAGPAFVRNFMKFIELEPLLYLWPMLMLILMTRNRQRVGDLLARTVVVQYRPELDPARYLPPTGRPTPPHDDEDDSSDS